jgi:hypothetical protein
MAVAVVMLNTNVSKVGANALILGIAFPRFSIAGRLADYIQ